MAVNEIQNTHSGRDAPADHPLLFPDLSPRDRRLFETAIQRLQSHSALAAFDPDDQSAQEIFRWADQHLSHIQEWFRAAGIGVRRHEGFPIIQLALEGDPSGHPLRRRLDKAQTGLLVCLWLLYHERAPDTEGFRVVVTVDEIYQRLGVLFRNDRRWPETPFRETLRFLEKHSLIESNLDVCEFPQGEVALLPTLLATFHFSDPTDARGQINDPTGEIDRAPPELSSEP